MAINERINTEGVVVYNDNNDDSNNKRNTEISEGTAAAAAGRTVDDNSTSRKVQESKNLYQAIILILVASLLFTFMSVCIVQASKSFPTFQLFFARQFAGLVYSVVYLKYYSQDIFGPNGIYMLQIINGFILSGATFAYMFSVTEIPLADAISLTYTGPVWVTIFMFVFLREPLTKTNVITIIMCLTGVVLISRPTFLGFSDDDEDDGSDGNSSNSSNRWVYIVICLVGAMLWGPNWYACRIMCAKNDFDPFVFVFYLCLVSVLISSILSGVLEPDAWSDEADPHSTLEWICLFGMGFLGFLGQALSHRALKLAPPANVSTVSNMRYMELFLSFLASVFVGDSISYLSVIGAVCICIPSTSQLVISSYNAYFKSHPYISLTSNV